MLTKLTKYEFKATGRIMLIFYAALLVFTLLNKITGTFESIIANVDTLHGMPIVLSWALYVVCIIAVSAMTVILIIQRFYKNLLQNEGYLMHVLPVKTWQHVVSKLIPSIVWTILSIGVIILSMLIVSGAWGDFFTSIGSSISLLAEEFGAGMVALGMILVGLLMFVSGIAAILKFYTAMSVGQLSDNYKIAASFAAYIGIEIAESIIEMIAIAVLGRFLIHTQVTLENLDANAVMALAMMLVYMIINASVYFIITERLLRKHLNLG